MAGATHGTRKKLSAKGKEKWYATLSFDGRKTERFAGDCEEDAYALGVKLCAGYNAGRNGLAIAHRVTLEQAVEEFLDRGVSDLTVEKDTQHLKQFVAENPKIKEVRDINLEVVKKWSFTLKHAFKYADATIQMKLQVFKAFVRWCWNVKHYLSENPIPERYIPSYNRTGHFYTLDELNKLRAPIASKDPQELRADSLLICAIEIAVHQGIRLSQVWGLNLHLYRPATRRLFLKGIKGAKDKEVLCNPVTWEQMQKAAKITGVTQGRIFVDWTKPGSLSQLFRRKRQRLGIPEGDFHDLKHTCVSSLEEQGYSMRQIVEITNTSRAALERYSHADEKKLQERFEGFRLGDGIVNGSVQQK